MANLKIRIVLFLLLGLACLPERAFAQFGSMCVDSNRISPYYPCPDPTYQPVCGCDGKTYRHICDAVQRHGINSYSDGPCSNLEFDIIPNVVTNDSYLNFTIVEKTSYPVTVLVMDIFGKVMYQQLISPGSMSNACSTVTNFLCYNFQFNAFTAWQVGPYIILVYNTKGDYRYQKFLKVGY